MKIRLICVGKTSSKEMQALLSDYEARLKHYCPFEAQFLELPSKMRKKSEEDQKQAEGEMILSKLNSETPLFLLDDKGKSYSSTQFAKFIQMEMNKGPKEIAFCIGGAFGFSQEVYQRAKGKISLSAMTFTHQMVRLFFTEQLYRAFSILRGERYHH